MTSSEYVTVGVYFKWPKKKKYKTAKIYGCDHCAVQKPENLNYCSTCGSALKTVKSQKEFPIRLSELDLEGDPFHSVSTVAISGSEELFCFSNKVGSQSYIDLEALGEVDLQAIDPSWFIEQFKKFHKEDLEKVEEVFGQPMKLNFGIVVHPF